MVQINLRKENYDKAIRAGVVDMNEWINKIAEKELAIRDATSILDKHLPEVVAIEKGEITPVNTEDFKQKIQGDIRVITSDAWARNTPKQPTERQLQELSAQLQEVSIVCECGHVWEQHDSELGCCLAKGGLCECERFTKAEAI